MVDRDQRELNFEHKVADVTKLNVILVEAQAVLEATVVPEQWVFERRFCAGGLPPLSPGITAAKSAAPKLISRHPPNAALKAAGQTSDEFQLLNNIVVIRRQSDLILLDAGAGPRHQPTAGKRARFCLAITAAAH